LLVRKRHFGLFFRAFSSIFLETEQSQKIEKPASNSHFLLTQLIIRQTHIIRQAYKIYRLYFLVLYETTTNPQYCD